MTESTAAHPPEARSAGWEDYVDIFYAPSRVFARRPPGAFWIPLLVLVVLMVALYFLSRDLFQPIFDAEFARNSAKVMKANPNVTADQMAKGKQMAGTIAGIGVGVVMLVGPLLTGLLLWLFGKLVGARQALGAAMVVGVFAFYPRILQAIVNAIQAFLMSPASLNSQAAISVGPARFFDPDITSQLLLMLLGRLDLFTIWVTVLLAIGLKVTGKIKIGPAFGAAVLVWLVGFLPMLPAALRAAG